MIYGDYSGFWRFWASKNKAKQSQFGALTGRVVSGILLACQDQGKNVIIN